MSFLYSLLIFMLSVPFFSCSTSRHSQKVDKSLSSNGQSWQVLASGTQSNVTEQKQLLVKSQSELDQLWIQAWAGREFGMEKPMVDFSKKWVVAAFLGTIPNGGNRIGIKGIELQDGDHVIAFQHDQPGPGCLVTMALEYPYVVASIDHLPAGKVKFIVNTVVQECK